MINIRVKLVWVLFLTPSSWKMFELHTMQFFFFTKFWTSNPFFKTNRKPQDFFWKYSFLRPFTFYLNYTNISLKIFLCSVRESNMSRCLIETMLYYNILSSNKKSQRKKWDRINLLLARLFFMYKLQNISLNVPIFQAFVLYNI